MDVLLGDGESLRWDVSVDIKVLSVGNVRKHGGTLRTGDIKVVYDRHLGFVHIDTCTDGILEIPARRYLLERLSEIEGSCTTIRRHAATWTWDIESLQKSNARWNWTIRRCLRCMSVQYDPSKDNTLSPSFPCRLFTSMPQGQRYVPYVQKGTDTRILICIGSSNVCRITMISTKIILLVTYCSNPNVS